MKKVIILCISIIIIACKSHTNPYANSLQIEPAILAEIDTAHYTTIQWQDSVYDFGKINRGDSVHVQYHFTNVGNTPLFIFNTHTTCGCTVTSFPKEPVFPGETGAITATFKSSTQAGAINKTIIVVANTKKSKNSRLIIRGSVQTAAGKNQ